MKLLYAGDEPALSEAVVDYLTLRESKIGIILSHELID